MHTEVRRDGELLADVLQLLETKTPLRAWRRDAGAALGDAIAAPVGDPIEAAKAERLERYLFAGPAPADFAAGPGRPNRRADRLRADLADLVPYGAGLHLLAGLG